MKVTITQIVLPGALPLISLHESDVFQLVDSVSENKALNSWILYSLSGDDPTKTLKTAGVDFSDLRKTILAFTSPVPSYEIASLCRAGFHYILTMEDDATSAISTILSQQSEDCQVLDNLHNTQLFVWRYFFDTNHLKISESINKYLGIPRGLSQKKLQSSLLSSVHPEDRKFAHYHLSQVVEKKTFSNVELRFRTASGEIEWFALAGEYYAPCNYIEGYAHIINRKKQLEHHLIESSTKFRKIQKQLKDFQKLSKTAVWHYDVDNQLLTFELSMPNLLPTPFYEITSLADLAKIVHLSDLDSFNEAVVSAIQNRLPVCADFRVVSKHEGSFFMKMESFIRRESHQNVNIIEGTIQDISQEKVYALKLASQNKQLEEYNKKILQRTQELEDAKSRAEESDHLKTAFLSNISHEIRTPISSISGFSELLRSDGLSHEQRNRYLELIMQSNRQLLRIFTDIIELSKITSNQLVLEPVPMNINRLLTELRDEYSDFAHNKGIEFQTDLTIIHTEAEIIADTQKIHRVLCTLLDNAIKFTPEGSIVLKNYFQSSTLIIEIRDTGIGIERDKLDILFKAFHQANDSLSRQHGGTGIGLAIAHGLIKLMNGVITIDSELNKGTTISLKLPVEFVKPQLSSVQVNKWKQFTVLVVEANTITFQFYQELLHNTGLKVLWAENLANAKDLLLSSNDISAILLDMSLSDGSGEELLFFAESNGIFLPVLVTTAENVDEVKTKCNGFRYFKILEKPFGNEELLSSFEQIFPKNTAPK